MIWVTVSFTSIQSSPAILLAQPQLVAATTFNPSTKNSQLIYPSHELSYQKLIDAFCREVNCPCPSLYWSTLDPKFTDWINNSKFHNELNVKVCCYLYLLKRVFQLNKELLGIFSFVRDAVQGLGKLTLQRQTEREGTAWLRYLKSSVALLLDNLIIWFLANIPNQM